MIEPWVRTTQDDAIARLANLLGDVRNPHILDFPDHPNVGDSAIALGEFAYFRMSGIKIGRVSSIGTASKKAFDDTEALLIHGGGNFGGLYEHHESHRLEIIRHSRKSHSVIQLPQSTPGISEASRAAYRALLPNHPVRIGARDEESHQQFTTLGLDSHLVPDSFHVLGAVEGPSPTAELTLIMRDDIETTASTRAAGWTDWPGDKPLRHYATSLRKRANRLPFGPRYLNPSPDQWRRIALSRFYRGVKILTGATIVTDRLHCALIALALGRRVIAVDNNNSKLSRYFTCWGGQDAPVSLTSTASEAVRLATRTVI